MGFAHPAKRRRLLGEAAEADEHGKAAGDLDQVIAEAGEGGRGGIRPVLGMQADERHEEGNERNGQHDDESTEPVRGENSRPDDQRDRGSRRHRRQHGAVPGVKIV